MRESQVRILSGELKYTEFGIIKKLRGRLEVVPARSHKPNYVGSSPTPATIWVIGEAGYHTWFALRSPRFEAEMYPQKNK